MTPFADKAKTIPAPRKQRLKSWERRALYSCRKIRLIFRKKKDTFFNLFGTAGKVSR